MASRRRRCCVVLAVGLATLLPREGAAQTARADRSTTYWVANGIITGVALGGGALLAYLPTTPKPFTVWPDDRVKGWYSPDAIALSDALVSTTLVMPVGPLVASFPDDASADALLVYGQAFSFSFLLNAASKHLMRRPRPYTYGAGPGSSGDFRCELDSDRCVSFYSGHSSTAFSAALSSVVMLSESTRLPDEMKTGAWGLELGLAAATAHLRVRGGKHFPSDVVLGALVGTAVGVGTPYLHREVWKTGEQREHSSVEGHHILAGLVGIAAGAALPLLVPVGSSDHLGFTLVPSVADGSGPGVVAMGDW